MLHVLGPNGPMNLEEFVNRHVSEHPKGIVLSDIATLSERAEERMSTKSFAPRTFVKMRAPQGVGIQGGDGLFVVIEMLPNKISAIENDPDAHSKIYGTATVDMLVGYILRTGHEPVYRECYVWSGAFVEHVLDETGEELRDIGKREAKKEQRPEQVEIAHSAKDTEEPEWDGMSSVASRWSGER